MITKEDIKNLADLARIEISEAEAEGLTSQIDSILGYVGQIKDSTGDVERAVPKLRNVMRDDVVTHTEEEYTEKLLNNAPSREGKYLKVKKIL
ncbi:MAG: aspartyl/glutamyl-tRNA(Asn/Gln) amidotransferase, C subunit [Parcubacteria bacterium C7867-006]|nr:MAG: aspartyl/glutamyl-tRNA(Asn/Gln) amidotransferase, C subunit [Parcubacteria bacterium C7867-006]